MWLLMGAVVRGLILVDEPVEVEDAVHESDSHEFSDVFVPEFSSRKTSLS
jgi:hypothetical protein